MKNQVLIIEDHKDLQAIFRKVVSNLDLEPIIQDRGDSALQYLKANIPSIILLDMNLPGLSGEEVLNFIHKSHAHCNTKIIIISANTQASIANYDKADHVLIKPISPRQLKVLIHSMLPINMPQKTEFLVESHTGSAHSFSHHINRIKQIYGKQSVNR